MKFMDRLYVTRMWLRGIWWARFAPSNAKPFIPFLHSAMEFSAWKKDMKATRRLIEIGADLSRKKWMAFRMAAAAGDMETLKWMLERVTPSAYAFTDAIAWAIIEKHPDVALSLHKIRDDLGIPIYQCETEPFYLDISVLSEKSGSEQGI